MEVRISPAVATDRPDWRHMRRTLWPETTDIEHEHDMDMILRGTGPGVTAAAAWIARGGADQALGFAEVSERPHANGCHTSPVAFLEGIWVAPDVRRQGIGGRLVAALEAWAAGRGLGEVGSDALLENALSHNAHRGWGFEETERIVHFRKAVGPAAAREAAE